jgi:hypothetical protein
MKKRKEGVFLSSMRMIHPENITLSSPERGAIGLASAAHLQSLKPSQSGKTSCTSAKGRLFHDLQVL